MWSGCGGLSTDLMWRSVTSSTRPLLSNKPCRYHPVGMLHAKVTFKDQDQDQGAELAVLSEAGMTSVDLPVMGVQLECACSADVRGSLAMCTVVGVGMCKREWSKAAMLAAREPCIVSKC